MCSMVCLIRLMSDTIETENSNFTQFSIIPGIAGHTGNDYIKNFIHYCKLQGYIIVSYNWPGCGNHKLSVCTFPIYSSITTIIQHPPLFITYS